MSDKLLEDMKEEKLDAAEKKFFSLIQGINFDEIKKAAEELVKTSAMCDGEYPAVEVLATLKAKGFRVWDGLFEAESDGEWQKDQSRSPE